MKTRCLCPAPNASKQSGAFQNDTRGSVAIIFIFFLFVGMGVIGGTVDLGSAYRTRAMLLDAADAASLSAVVNGSASLNAAAAMTTDGAVPGAAAAAEAAFMAQVAGQDGSLHPSATATVVKQGTTVTATVSFIVDVPTHFMGVFGVSSVSVAGHATSVNGTPAFVDFYLLLDNSPSMGVAATQNDIDTMVNATGGCAFACHETDKPGTDNYSIAHNLGVTTRIDVLRQATQKLMDTAVSTATVPNQFRMSIDTFNINLHPISPLTTNLAAAKADAAAIDLMVVPAQSWNDDRDTNFDVVLPQLDAKVPASGSGVTSADPQRVAFLVTDGVQDMDPATALDVLPGASSSPNAHRLIQAFNPSVCTAMKNRGIKVAVIYTTFMPLPTNGFYNAYVAPWQTEINPHIKDCASPGYFFEVSPKQGIDEAMKTLFLKVVAEARITS